MKPITNHNHLRNVLTACGVTCHRFAHIMKGDYPFNTWVQVYYGRVAISEEMSEAIHQMMFGEESPYQFKAVNVEPLTAEQYVRSHRRKRV